MAIKFPTSNISENNASVYTLQEFKGCDYTTTPTLVDDSRAIEISNYVPINNALVKRNGWEVVNTLKHGLVYLIVHNIWKINDYSKSTDNAYYILYASQKGATCLNPKLYYTKTLDSSEEDYELLELYSFENPIEDTYSYAINFDSRLFILVQEEYLMVYFNEGVLACDKVRNHAYTPTTVIGLGQINGTESPSTLEEFNLLKNECYVELIKYPKGTEEKTYKYDIGQFFSGDITIKEINGNTFTNGLEVEGVGIFNYDTITGYLSLVRPSGEAEETLEYIKVLVGFNQDNTIVEKMRFGIPYGSHGYKDRLFLSGNPSKPNMDIHSCETHDEGNNWRDYTYFGDMSYQLFGSDNQKIIGYGLMSNGYMAVFKETTPNEPNLYFRHSDYQQDDSGNLIETFPITVSGVQLNANSQAQVITFGNDLLLNVASGVYRVNASESTATQSYDVKEVSYFIRNNLGKDMSNSCSIVHGDKLYLCRKDLKGNKRVYIADLNKYSYKDNHRIYEWWVLDNINAEKFFVFDDTFYFSDFKRGICKFSDIYSDKYIIENSVINVNNVDYSRDVFVDTDSNLIVLSDDSEILDDVYITSDLEKSYKNFKDKTKLQFDQTSVDELEYLDFYINTDNIEIKFDQKYLKKIEFVYSHNDALIFNTSETGNNFGIYKIESYQLYTLNSVTNLYVTCTYLADSDVVSTTGCGILFGNNTQYDILEMYEEGQNAPLSQCYIEGEDWYQNYHDEYGNEYIRLIGAKDTVKFSKLKIGVVGEPIKINFKEAIINNVEFYITKPIESFWYSKYNDLGRLDYLKTATNIIFVPEVNYGGYTQVGYKTAKNEVSYYSLAERAHFDFEYVDFDYFFFGNVKMAKTYSSKKKIKNFSFIQLKIASNDDGCSSIVSLSFRYKYTRYNKGVK